jgi:hypothetical protein
MLCVMGDAHHQRGWLGPWITALVATAALIGAMFVVHQLVPTWWSVGAIVGLSAIWAAWDSSRIGLLRYRSQMANEPVMVLFMCWMLWLIFFPWYLVIRQGIRRGLVPLKEGPAADGVWAESRNDDQPA